jgi:hypothetical protein
MNMIKQVFLATLTYVAVSDSSAAYVAAPKETPTVAVVSGNAAAALLDLHPAQPVLIGESLGKPVLIILTVDANDAPRLLEDLFEVNLAGCTPGEGPFFCCNPATNTQWINSRQGWADFGLVCDPTEQQSDVGDAPADVESNQFADPEVVDISHDTSSALYDQAGVTYPIIESSTASGRPRILVSPPKSYAEADMSASELLAHIAFDPMRPLSLAWHPVQAPECGGPFDGCPASGTTTQQKCRRSNAHWYYRNTAGQWCRRAACCRDNCVCG